MKMTTIEAARLEELLRKERAHDDYLAAARAIRSRSAAIELEALGIRPRHIIPVSHELHAFSAGYRAAHRDISQAILDAGEIRRVADAAVPVEPRAWAPVQLDGARR